jgi:anti-sigma factor (TIGR02949 family)
VGKSIHAKVQKLNCQKVPDLLHSYVDHELDVVQTSEIERHLEQCEECDLAYRSQIALRSSLQDRSFYYRAPADLKSRITSSLQKEAAASQNVIQLSPPPLPPGKK